MSGAQALALLALLAKTGAAANAVELPEDTELEARGTRIGTIAIRVLPIFDPQSPGERKSIFRLADRLHVDTRPSVIEAQLLFRSGDPFSRRVCDETERNLRALRFVKEPEIRVIGYHDGVADLEVITHELWTTNPGVSFSRSGGSNTTGFELEELNLLGFGKHLAFDYQNDIDRSTYTLTWKDPNIVGSRWRDELELTESDDGEGQALLVERPFFSLDARWSAGFAIVHDDSIQSVYRLGHPVAEFQQDVLVADARFGWSKGLHGGWTRRWTGGLRHEKSQFSEAPDGSAFASLPDDRSLSYPYLRLERIQDDFDTTRNLDLIARTEDQHFGIRYAIELGWAATTWGSDRNAALLRAESRRGFRLGSGQSLFLHGKLTSRFEGGATRDALLSGGTRYYRQTSQRSTFFAAITADVGQDLDADHELLLGGDNGLRGYPLRYQTGSGRALMTIEQRVYTRYSLWQLADIGGAVFLDMGRTWGESAFGPTENLGWLKDVGFGLRLGHSRSGLGNVIHLDVAFPLNGDRSISEVQFLVQTKRSY